MASYRYQIFVPGGNKTALVLGVDGRNADSALRKTIQDRIFAKHKRDADGEVEQVGFISTEKFVPKLFMTGGEFCGNATRSAAAYYLWGARGGNVEIKVSGAKKPVKAGLSAKGALFEAWADMPLPGDLFTAVTPLKGGLYWITIEGISHLIVPQVQSMPFLNKILSCENNDARVNIAIEFLKNTINENYLSIDKACGIIFLENIADMLKMHPFVHVLTADTAYYETACGSGAMCVGLFSCFLCRESVNIPLIQPSGKIIRVGVKYADVGILMNGRISGEIQIGETGEVTI